MQQFWKDEDLESSPKTRAMASACGIVVAAAQSKLLSKQWDAPSSLSKSDSFQVRASCANLASSSSFPWAVSASEFLACSGQGLRKHEGLLNQTRRRIRIEVSANGEEGEEPREAVSERWSLDELDQQLKVLSNRETSAPRQVPISRQTIGDSEPQQSTVNGSWPKLEWPTLTTGFFVYAAIGLLLLTIVDNVLYKIFLGPPGVDRREPFKTTVPVMPRYRVTTLQEEREAREARDAEQEAIAAQSRQAPLPLE